MFERGVRDADKERTLSVPTVECIAPDGLGFGAGSISVKEQTEQGVLALDTLGHIRDVLVDDPQAFKSVEVDDDGCGDGRPWHKIVRAYIDENGQKQYRFFGASKLRAKVFGGGLVTVASMWRTIRGVPRQHETISQDRAFMAEKLAEHGVSHGAHSDDHAEGQQCGCGAIDKYPEITANAVTYRNQTTNVLKVVYGEEFADNQAAIEQTFGVYEALAKHAGYLAGANGKDAMDQILESGAVVKELRGRHIEDTIVINDVEGTTLDQQYFTETVKNRSTGDKPQTVQAFSVDVWRGRRLADVAAKIAQDEDPRADIDTVRRLAFADFLVRTLAVAGTLTAGDLPVYRRRLQPAAAQ